MVDSYSEEDLYQAAALPLVSGAVGVGGEGEGEGGREEGEGGEGQGINSKHRLW